MKHRAFSFRTRMRLHFALRLRLAALLCVTLVPALRAQTTAVFTNSVTIAATNTTYDGQNIVINGCTVSVNGIHAFNSVAVTNGAVLTHQAATTSQAYSLVLTITNNLLVDGSSSINVSATGYLPGYTLGNTTNGAASFTAGGSYGGLGGLCCNSTGNAVYGDYRNPNELGSGSGTYGTGAAGGGLVQITAANAQVDGTILANGGNSYDGGSGGGILLNVGTLSGSGHISANGGNSIGGNDGGGGGRVAIYYGTNTFNISSNVTATGGSGPTMPGSVGTVYLQQPGSPGQLIINSHGAATAQWTPLGLATDADFQVDALFVSGSNVMAAPEHQMPVFAGAISITGGGELTDQPTTTNQEYSLLVTVTNNLLVDGSSSINVSACGYLPGYTLGNTTNGAATYTAGGSYGGLGGLCCSSTSDAVYGDFHNPNELGSGSGTYGGGASGGGLARIMAASAQVDGAILANGGNGYDGGSGGGILLNVGTLKGGGHINANGGNADGNDGGGGGRVAIYYGTSTFNLASNVAAYGGESTDAPSLTGSAGTVYLQQTGSPGQLVINNNGSATAQLTLLGQTSDSVFTAGNLVLSGAGTVAATVSGAPIQAGSLSLVNGAVLAHLPATTNREYSLVLTVTNNLLVDASSSINVSGLGYLEGYTLGNTTNGAAYFTAGGSYGGLGGLCCNSTDNAVYGDFRYPNELGSGSGTYSSTAGTGGGLAQITAGAAQVDGTILANGLGGNPLPYDGGSGGGILLKVGTLSGAGQISANGGSASGNGGGGGGRVAIYYGTNSFNLSSNVTAYGGYSENYPSLSGSAGTVYLQQTGGPGQLVIKNNGTPTAQWTPLGVATDVAVQVDSLIISGSNVVVVPEHEMPIFAGSISITNGAELADQPTTTNQQYSLLLTITNNLLVDASSTINVSGTGYLPGYTQGNTTNGAASFTAGGSYGGLGGICCNSSNNAVYGDFHYPNDLGSGSGTYSTGAAGGGLVQITAGAAQVDGTILADGGNSYDGGSGGGILLNVGTLSGAGQINANGGIASGNDGGGGGRVAIYTWTAMLLPTTNVLANGGKGPTENGQNGSVYIAAQPYLTFLNVSEIWHGTEQIAWSSVGINPSAGAIADVVVSKGGVTYFQQTAPATGSVSWNTALVADGSYTLTVSLLNSSGQQLNQISQTELVNNTVAWHEGTLSASQTWGSNTVNAVDQDIIIPSGVTLTIAPGAIIKFAQGTGIIIEAGGTLDASGATVGAPIIFTSLADDSAGGDSNEDGHNSIPLMGDWDGISVSGQFLVNPSVQIRYVIQSHSGTLTASQEWFGAAEHLITGKIIIPTGVTLTIDPGAVVKFGLGLNLTVQSGGTLIANGTVPQPIFFTSINDESVGAVTNGVLTTPAAGDWDSIYLAGGQATFNHVAISYGGGPDSLNSGLISIIATNSVLAVSDSILSQGFYKGIQTEYGTANITNCLITGCDRGIQVGLNGPTVVNVVNCTLDNNNVGIWAHGGVLNLANTIVADSVSTGVEFCCGSALATFEYCDIWAANGNNYSGVAVQTGINGNISANPNFVNAAQGNYELNYGSPCINAADGKVAPLTDLTGAPCYNDPRTSDKTGVTNASGLYPDIGAFEFVQNATSDVDLVVNSVTGPVAETAGQTVIIHWNDVNVGTGNAIGPWHDAVSLASAGGTNLAATVLVAQNVVLGPGETYAASASVVVPSGVDGPYQWQVHVNSQGDVFEGINWTNNITSAAGLTTLTDPTLTVGGTAVTNLFTAAGQSDVFALTSSGGTFVLTVQGSTPGCALALYVGDSYVPSPSAFDQQSSQFNSPLASVTVPGVIGHTYYVVVYARSLDAPAVSFVLSAAPLSFALNSVSPASMANSGPVTLQIFGSQLAANETFSLTGPGGTFAASSAQSTDPTVAYATFNLNGATPGAYSLAVTQPAGPTLTLTNAVTVSAPNSVAAAAALLIQLQIPPAYRSDRPFNGAITYRNAGEVDMPAPLLILTSGGVAGLALQGSTNFLTNDLLLIGASFQGPAGTLTPGQSGSIPFSALCAGQTPIPFAVNYETANATNLVNYGALESTFRPPGYSQTNWNLIWTNLQAKAGPTWGGFVTLMDFYSTEMARENASGTFYLLQDVLGFAFADLLQQANANVFGTLYLSDTNHPLAGVYLTLAGADGGTNGSSATSAFDGTFAIGGLAPGTYSVDAPGYWLPAPVEVTIPASDYIAGLSIIVNQGGTISGTLSNSAYTGYASVVQGAKPFLTNITVEAFGVNGEALTTISDQFGRYSFTGLPPDTYEIVELGENIGGQVASIQYLADYATNLVVSDGTSLVQNFLVETTGALVEARVYATNTSTPIANATVSLVLNPTLIESTNTDTDGLFTFSVAGGSYLVDIAAPGYAPFEGMLPANSVLTLPPTIYLVPASTFNFSLNSSSTTAITNGIVTLTSNGVAVAIGYPDSNGLVTFTNLAPGTYGAQETAYGYQEVDTTITVGLGGVVSNFSSLTALGGIVGSVSDGNGNPVVGIDLNIYGDGATNQSFRLTTQTDAGGNYSFLGLVPGSYGISVGDDGGVEPRETTIVSNEQHAINFTLAGSVVQGTVLASDGVTPVPVATVALAQGGQIITTAMTDTNGIYRFRVLIPGTYNLTASAPFGLSPNLPVTVTASANLAVAPLVFGSLSVSVVVTDNNRDPLANAVVVLFPAKGGPAVPQDFAQVTSSQGVCGFGGLVAGQYLIVIHQPGFARFYETLNLSVSSNLTFSLRPAVTMSGTIQDSSGAPISGATVSVYDPAAGILAASTNTDSSGNYTAVDLGLGSYTVLISQANYQTTEITNVVVNVNPFTQNATLSKKTTLVTGTITDSSGDPLPTALVEISDNAGAILAFLPAESDGTWSTDQLPPGSYSVILTVPGFKTPASIAINLLAGTPVTLGSALPACATDDEPQLGTFALISTGIGNLVKSLTGGSPPQQINVQPIPQPGPCPQAQAAFAAAKKALALKDAALLNWEQGYQGTSQALGATGAVGLIQTLQTAVDGLAAFSGVGTAEAVAANTLTAGAQNAVALSDTATVGGHILSTLYDAKNSYAGTDFHSVSSVAMFLTGISSDLINNGLDIKTLTQLAKDAVASPGSKLGLLGDAINLLISLKQGVDDYQAALGQDASLQFTYIGAIGQYNIAVDNVNFANLNCPPPTNQPPPPPPTPTPGPMQTIPNARSADPNAKFASGVGKPEWVAQGGAITYSVEFANETNASAPAQTVTITDPLSANLNWSTLQLTAIAFNNVVIAIPPGVQTFSTNVSVGTDPNPVQVTASLNAATGVISWLMKSIDPVTGQLVTDPLAGFLPPDNAKGQGEGYVEYTIAPKSGLATGVQITNRASIVFDVNAPIATPTTTNTMDVTPPSSSITALPASSSVTIPVKWSGHDVGSGIAGFDIYVSTNGGPWAAWLLNTTKTSAVFAGSDFNTYGFYSVAYDQAGNIEAAPGKAEAQTTVSVAGFPKLLRQPTNLVVVAGNSASFSVVAQGAAPLQYQWKKGTTVLANIPGKISGATAATLVISSVAAGDDGSYSVFVNDKLGGVSSSNAVLQAVPGIKIVAPAVNAVFTNPVVTVTGTASDANEVLWQLNGGAFQPATGQANWSASVTLRAGTNIFAAKSVDQNGDASAIATRSLTLEVNQAIMLVTNGPGGITGIKNGQILMIGKSYSARAIPRSGNLFSNWTGSITSASNPLVFLMQSNMVLQANFVTNDIRAVAGVYSGLFYPTNGVTEASSGFITATITSTSTGGTYSAKLLLDGDSSSFSGALDLTGIVHTNLVRAGKTPLSVILNLDLNPSGAQMIGSVSSDVAGWNSVIRANRAVFSAHANPATDYAGQFTLILSPGANAPLESADGYANVAVTNTLAGISTLSGATSDGTPLLWSVPIARDGSIPLYQSLYSGKGSVLGWIIFTNQPQRNASAQIIWIKPAQESAAPAIR